jgi:putative membrane protein
MKRLSTFLVALLTVMCLSFFGCSQQKGSSEKEYSNPQTAGSAQQQQQESQTASQQLSGDQRFISEAAQDGRAEVELAQLAAKKSSDPAVKRFAQKVVTDHSRANQQLESLPEAGQVAQSANVPEDKRRTMDDLANLSGKDFDRKYIDEMVSDHEQAVSRFQDAASTASDPQVKQFATKTLPTLKQHLEMAKSLQARLSRAGGGSTQQ